MCIATSLDLSISVDTMHKYVFGLETLKEICACFQTSWSEELEKCTQILWRQDSGSRNMSPCSTRTPSGTTDLGISLLLLIIMKMLKSWYSNNFPSHSDVLHGFLKTFYLTWVHVHCNVMLRQVSIVGCNSHKVDEDS